MKVVIRTDASLRIGTGHVMRCLTLADMLGAHGGTVRFVSRHLPDVLSSLLKERGHDVTMLPCVVSTQMSVHQADANSYAAWLGVSQEQDARETAQALEDIGQADWMIVDHYGLDARWEKAVRTCAKNVFVIDDLADRAHDCDVLLDQNYYADMATRYDGLIPDTCTLLLGSRYALLRSEFHEHRKTVVPRDGAVRRLLVFFGGMDLANATSVALEAIARLDRHEIDIDIVIGSGHPARDAIQARCNELDARCHIQTPHMAELMAAADLAIGAGGTATWERCALGLPAMALCVADNQRQLIRDAGRAGLLYAPDSDPSDGETQLIHLRALLENAALRNLISRNCLKAVDGLGTARIAQQLGLSAIEMRRADMNDSADLLAWRNSPQVRAVSHTTDLIGEETHHRWLLSVLENPRRELLIGSRDGRPVGVVRFDLNDRAAEVSIYLVPDVVGQGYGTALLLAAEQWLKTTHKEVTTIHAQVLRDNASSHRLFGNCQYVVESTHYTKVIGS
jgi:UDP-2,4-diacetamido-2,4,6-trideoxy-beta-L-altropyranose hydrolase